MNKIENLYTLYGNEYPSSIEFNSYTKYIGCKERYKKYSNRILKLNSIFLVLEDEYKNIKKLILDNINNDIENVHTSEEYNINIDMLIQRVHNPIKEEICECLSSAIDNIDIYSINNKDIFNPNDLPIYTKKEVTLKQKEFNSSIVIEIDKYINKMLMSIFDNKEIYELILRLVKYQEAILKMNFIIIYRDFKDYYKCLKEHCKEFEEGLVNDYFLYNNENFIIPIDIPTGKIKINKFLTNIKLNEKQKNNIIKLTKYYNNFIKNKKNILDKAYNKLKDMGVKDEDNVFKELLETFEFDKINTIF